MVPECFADDFDLHEDDLRDCSRLFRASDVDTLDGDDDLDDEAAHILRSMAALGDRQGARS